MTCLRRQPPRLLQLLLTLPLLLPLGGCSGSSPAKVEPSVPENTVGMNVLGAGTDVFGPYAVDANVKGRVLDVDALNAQARLVFNPDVQEYRYEEAEGRTISEYASHLAVGVGLTGSYMFFSGELQTNFSQDAYRRTEYSYASIIERHWRHSLKLEPGLWGTGERLRPYLVPLARQAINDADPTGKRWTGAEVIAAYGTHVMTGIYVGGRLDFHMAVQVMNAQHQSSLMAYAKVSYSSSFASAGLTASLDEGVKTAMDAYNRVGPVINAKGGASQYAHPENDADYQLWKASLDTSPVFCGIVEGGLMGIWELADTPERRAELQAAYATYAAAKGGAFIPLVNKITDLKVLNAGTGTSVTLPQGYKLIKSLSGDTVSGDLNMGIWYDTREADQVYLAYLAEETAAPVGISGIHLQSGDAVTDAWLLGGATHESLYGTAEPGCAANATMDLNAHTCGSVSWNEWYSGWCAYYFFSATCNAPGIPLFLHHVMQTDQTDAIRCVVIGDEVAIDSNQPAATRAAHIWWGPEDVNRDGKLGDAADADWVLQHVTWVGNLTDGAPVNLNHGTQSYHRWGWYDCGLGQGYDYGWFNATNAAADAQYLGVCLASPP